MINNSWKIVIIRILIKDLMMNLKNICKFKDFDDEFEKHW
jgi:hypothetical protein